MTKELTCVSFLSFAEILITHKQEMGPGNVVISICRLPFPLENDELSIIIACWQTWSQWRVGVNPNIYSSHIDSTIQSFIIWYLQGVEDEYPDISRHVSKGSANRRSRCTDKDFSLWLRPWSHDMRQYLETWCSPRINWTARLQPMFFFSFMTPYNTRGI